jgi:hypothetical protein
MTLIKAISLNPKLEGREGPLRMENSNGIEDF